MIDQVNRSQDMGAWTIQPRDSEPSPFGRAPGEAMSQPSELDLIDWFRDRISLPPSVAVGIGDDTAVLGLNDREWLATVDMLIEGVHFELSQCRARDVGRKAMGVNLSDIAAMAGQPTHALVAIGIPPGREDSLARELLAGIDAMAREYGVAIVGGDTNRSPTGLVVCVTLLGHATGRGAVLRSGARPTDVLFVTGHLGYSLSGRHLDVQPRVKEAQLLHTRYSLRAMLDVSDGLAADVRHLAKDSNCGIVMDEHRIPIAEATIDDGRSPLDHALSDGEDFELLFAIPADQADELESSQPLAGVPVARIGECIESHGAFLRDSNGGLRPLDAIGFVHKW